jgi:hypothetical protein
MTNTEPTSARDGRGGFALPHEASIRDFIGWCDRIFVVPFRHDAFAVAEKSPRGVLSARIQNRSQISAGMRSSRRCLVYRFHGFPDIAANSWKPIPLASVEHFRQSLHAFSTAPVRCHHFK